jgi:hypothetical protein
MVSVAAMVGIHLPFANACTKIIGVGGLENKNAVQLLHTCYTIQHLLKGNFNDLFSRLASEKEAPKKRQTNSLDKIILELEFWWRII